MLTHADHLAAARERTAALADAHRRVAEVIRAHDLLAPNLAMHHRGADRVLCRADNVERPRIQIDISMWTLPTEFLRWCDALAPERITCRRRTGVDICLWTVCPDDDFGLYWQIGSALNWRADLRDQLPNIPAPWHREGRSGRRTNAGHLSVADLRTTMTALGYPMETT